jgi:tetratricopeptide (TPR) repeat protein
MNLLIAIALFSWSPAAAQPAVADVAVLAEKSEQAKRALDADRLEDAVKLCEEILAKDKKDMLAWLRLGLARYRQHRYPAAEEALEKALSAETSPELRIALWNQVEEIHKVSQEKAAKPEPAAKTEPSAKTEPAAKTEPPAPAKPVLPSMAGPGDIEKWYEEGLEAYARGDLDGASAVFLRILAADPKNPAARKALDRISAEKRAAAP